MIAILVLGPLLAVLLVCRLVYAGGPLGTAGCTCAGCYRMGGRAGPGPCLAKPREWKHAPPPPTKPGREIPCRGTFETRADSESAAEALVHATGLTFDEVLERLHGNSLVVQRLRGEAPPLTMPSKVSE